MVRIDYVFAAENNENLTFLIRALMGQDFGCNSFGNESACLEYPYLFYFIDKFYNSLPKNIFGIQQNNVIFHTVAKKGVS